MRVNIWNDRNFEITNIKITKDDNFIFEFFFYFLKIIRTLTIFNNFSSCEILIFHMVELNIIFQIIKFYKIFNYRKLINFYIISWLFGKLAKFPN